MFQINKKCSEYHIMSVLIQLSLSFGFDLDLHLDSSLVASFCCFDSFSIVHLFSLSSSSSLSVVGLGMGSSGGQCYGGNLDYS